MSAVAASVPAVPLKAVKAVDGWEHPGKRAFVDESTRRLLLLSEGAATLHAACLTSGDLERALAEARRASSEAEVAGWIQELRELELFHSGESSIERRMRLRAKQDEQRLAELRRTVEYATRSLPYYRKRFGEAGVRAEALLTPEDVRTVPLLIKKDIQLNFPEGFIPDGVDLEDQIAKGEFRFARSSGTTSDERLQVIRDERRRAGMRSAAVVPYYDSLLDISTKRAVRSGRFTTMNCVGIACIRDMPAMDARSDGHLLRFIPPEDPGRITKEEVEKLFREIEAFGVDWLFADPTYLASVTYVAMEHGLEIPRIKAISATFEYLTRQCRKVIEEGWRCAVHCHLSMSETSGFEIAECSKGNLHFNDTFLWWEVLRDGKPVRPGELGHLVLTVLKDRVPLIRFATEDLVLAGDEGFCKCGGLTHTLGAICGRAKDVLVGAGDAPVTIKQVDDTVSQVEGVRQYQIRQGSRREDVTAAVVTAPGADRSRISGELQQVLRDLLGPAVSARVVFEPIPTERSGKFRLAKSDLVTPDFMRNLL